MRFKLAEAKKIQKDIEDAVAVANDLIGVAAKMEGVTMELNVFEMQRLGGCQEAVFQAVMKVNPDQIDIE